MSDPRIVTPQEAQERLRARLYSQDSVIRDYAHTVATEPDRTRAAVVKALREVAYGWDGSDDPVNAPSDPAGEYIYERADAIENGADYA